MAWRAVECAIQVCWNTRAMVQRSISAVCHLEFWFYSLLYTFSFVGCCYFPWQIVGARFAYFSVLFLRNSGRPLGRRRDPAEILYKFISLQLTGITLSEFINLFRTGTGSNSTQTAVSPSEPFHFPPRLINWMESGYCEKLALICRLCFSPSRNPSSTQLCGCNWSRVKYGFVLNKALSLLKNQKEVRDWTKKITNSMLSERGFSDMIGWQTRTIWYKRGYARVHNFWDSMGSSSSSLVGQLWVVIEFRERGKGVSFAMLRSIIHSICVISHSCLLKSVFELKVTMKSVPDNLPRGPAYT